MRNDKLSLGKLRTWSNKLCLNTLTFGFGSTAGLMCLYDGGHKFFATTLTVLGLGSAYLYWRNAARIAIRSNHAVIVTGCDSGLGYSLALHCRSLNAAVIAGVLKPNGLGAQDLIKNGIRVIPLDVTRSDSVAKFGTEVRELTAKENLVVHAVVNNAGVMIFGEFEWQTDNQTRQQIEVNLLGTMAVTKELMPLIRSMRSRIIVVTSHCSSQPLPGIAAYAASKAALSAWATALRVELAKYGIDVVCFVPGSFTRESNLLARQSEHFASMASAMTEEARSFYGNYFTRYSQYLSGISREIVPERLENPLLYDIFNGALTDVYPRGVYKCEPWRYTLYHFLFRTTPMRIRDRLVEKFMIMPRWEPGDSCPKESDQLDASASGPASPELRVLEPGEDETPVGSMKSNADATLTKKTNSKDISPR